MPAGSEARTGQERIVQQKSRLQGRLFDIYMFDSYAAVSSDAGGWNGSS